AISFKIRLLSFRHHIKRVANVKIERLILGCMADAVFADKLHTPLRVALINPHRSGRQWDTERIFLRVFKLNMDLDRFLDGLPWSLGVMVVVLLSIHFENLIEAHPRGLEQADLLGLFVLEVGATFERIKVILGDWLLGKLRRGRSLSAQCRLL